MLARISELIRTALIKDGSDFTLSSGMRKTFGVFGSWIVDCGSWIVDSGSWIVDRGLLDRQLKP